MDHGVHGDTTSRFVAGKVVFDTLKGVLFQTPRDHSLERVAVYNHVPMVLLDYLGEGAVVAFHPETEITYRGVFTAETSTGMETSIYYRVGDLRMTLARAAETISPQLRENILIDFDVAAQRVLSRKRGNMDRDDLSPLHGYGQNVARMFVPCADDIASRTFKPKGF